MTKVTYRPFENGGRLEANMDGNIADWKLIPDWDEALAARPWEDSHFKVATKEPTTSYSEAWHWWTACAVTQRNEEDLKNIKARCKPAMKYWGKRVEREWHD